MHVVKQKVLLTPKLAAHGRLNHLGGVFKGFSSILATFFCALAMLANGSLASTYTHTLREREKEKDQTQLLQ